MQRVVRSTLVGILTIAAVTACGDKVTIPQGTTVVSQPGTNVLSVTVSPASASLNVGDKITLAASVNAEAGVQDRTVTWTSADPTIAAVDANGVVTAVKAGNTSVIAASKANPNVKGAAAITVNAGPIAQPAVVTISTINQTVCVTGGGCSSVPANLGNATGQLDVTLNVDPGTQKLAGVDLLMNCNAAGNFPASSDTVVATQNLSGAASSQAAEAASAPVTLSFNTAAFNNQTGATAFKNGSCVLRARARLASGQVVASSNQPITLANTDVAIGNITSTLTATDNQGLLWNGGNVTVSVVPVFYTAGRTAATTTIQFEGKSQTVTNTAGGAVTATFTDGNGSNPGGATDIDGITDPNAGATLNVSIIDASGQPFVTNPCGANTVCTSQSVLAGAPAPVFPAAAPFRLDTQKPLAGTFPVANNTLQNTGSTSWVGANFRFASDSASGFRGPNANSATAPGNICPNSSGGVNTVTCNSDRGGVDKVTVVFQTAPAGTSKTSSSWVNTTSASSLNETTTNGGDIFRMITTDALGNADTSATTAFGVDKTAPTVTQTAGPAQNSLGRDSSQTIGGTGSYQFSISDNLSGPLAVSGVGTEALVAQTSLTAGISSSTNLSGQEGKVFQNGTENTAGPCVIGRYNASASSAGPNALPVFARDGTPMGFCTPVPYALQNGTSVPANIPGALASGNKEGYFTTEIIAVDQAGNQTSPIVKEVVEDATNPTVTSVDLPGSLTGNSSFTVQANATDNVDLVGSFITMRYSAPTNGGGTPILLQYPTTPGPGVPWDNVLTRSATLTPVVNNVIKNLQVSTGSGSVTAVSATNSTPGVAGNADSVIVTAQDEVNRQGTARTAFQPTFTFNNGSSATSPSWSTNFTGTFTLSANNLTVSNCPTAGCTGGAATANPTSTTLTATASGATSVFTNPFTQVSFWYQTVSAVNTHTWFFAGNSTTGTARDNGTNRFWDFTFTFTPPKVAPDGTNLTVNGTQINMIAIGQNSNGDGLVSSPVTLTLTNP